MMNLLKCSFCERRASLPSANHEKAREHRVQGNEAFKKKDYINAVREYSEAIILEPTEPALWVNRCIAFRHLKLWSDSEKDARQAIKLQPSNDKAHYGLVLALKNLGNKEEAQEACDAGIALHPGNKQLQDLRASLTEVAAEPPLAKVQPSPKPAAKKTEAPKAAPKKRDYTIDYSKWKDIDDSDDEVPQVSPTNVESVDNEKEDEEDSVGLSANPTMQEREYIIEQMMQMIRNARNKAKEEMKSESHLSHLTDQYLPSGPKLTSTDLPDDYRKPVGVISVETLAKFKSGNPRMLISVYGDIFDVSNRTDQYGPDTNGTKKILPGKDATWALITGHEDVAHCNKFYDIFKLERDKLERFLRVACHWMVSYRDDHGQPVGRLDKWDGELEREMEAPPAEELKDPCPTQ